MEWILVAAYTFLFIALILKLPGFEIAGIPRFWLIAAFCLKVVAGISLGLIYTYFYTDKGTADTFKFFDDSRILFNSIFTKPYDFIRMFTGIGGNHPELRNYYVQMSAWLNTDVMFNDNKTIIRINTLFRFFSLGKYYVHVVFINFISFLGLVLLLKTFLRHLPSASRLLFLTTFLLPSVLFWGSGLLKDGLLLFALGLSLESFNRLLYDKFKIRALVLLLMGLVLLIFTKPYVILAIFPGMIAWYWSKNNQGWIVVTKFCASYLIYFIIVFNIHLLLPKYNVAEIIYWKQKNFQVLAELTNAKSVFRIPELKFGVWSILQNSPVAFFNTLLRPFPGDVKGNMLILASAIENLLILSVAVMAFFFRKKERQPIRALTVFSLFFVVMIFVLSGLITPILGALVRYRVPALPFLLFVFISVLDSNRLPGWLGKDSSTKKSGKQS